MVEKNISFQVMYNISEELREKSKKNKNGTPQLLSVLS